MPHTRCTRIRVGCVTIPDSFCLTKMAWHDIWHSTTELAVGAMASPRKITGLYSPKGLDVPNVHPSRLLRRHLTRPAHERDLSGRSYHGCGLM